jgi:hypothetical protein
VTENICKTCVWHKPDSRYTDKLTNWQVKDKEPHKKVDQRTWRCFNKKAIHIKKGVQQIIYQLPANSNKGIYYQHKNG